MSLDGKEQRTGTHKRWQAGNFLELLAAEAEESRGQAAVEFLLSRKLLLVKAAVA